MTCEKWEARSEFAEFVWETMEEHDAPGVSVAVADASDVLYAEGFGYRDRERGLPASPETVYGVASITKSFAALAIMLSETDGAITAADTVIKHLPEFTFSGDEWDRAMSIHHFLTHTSGLPPTGALRYCMVRSMEGDPMVEQLREAGRWEEWVDRDPIDDYEGLLQYLAEVGESPLGRPGEQFSYSNDAYSLLGTIVQRANQCSFEEYVQERILGPLGMHDSTFDLECVQSCDEATQLYAKDSGGDLYLSPRWQDAPAMVGAGFLRSTALDLVRCGQFYLRGGEANGRRIIGADSLTRMATAYFPAGRMQSYGYGLMIRPDYSGVTLVEHGGSLKGISSHFGYVPEKGLTVSVLCNLQGVPVSKIWLAAVNLLLGLPIDEKRSEEPEYDAGEKELSRFVGTYRSGEGARLYIYPEDGEMYAEIEGEKSHLRPSGPDTAAIMSRGQESMIRFIPGPTGEVRAVYAGLRIIPKISDEPDG